MTLEALLRTTIVSKEVQGKPACVSPDFRVRVLSTHDDQIRFNIRPVGHIEESLDFVVKGNQLEQV